jgi:hypothetical protein
MTIMVDLCIRLRVCEPRRIKPRDIRHFCCVTETCFYISTGSSAARFDERFRFLGNNVKLISRGPVTYINTEIITTSFETRSNKHWSGMDFAE